MILPEVLLDSSVLLSALRPVKFPPPRVVEGIDERIGIADDVPGTAGRPVTLGGVGIGRCPPASVPGLKAARLGAVDERRLIDNVELHRTGSDDARAASETVFLAVEVSSVDGKVNLLRESARTNRASENGGAVVLNHSVRLEMTIQPSSAFKNSGKGIRYLVRKVVQSVLNALNILFNMLYL